MNDSPSASMGTLPRPGRGQAGTAQVPPLSPLTRLGEQGANLLMPMAKPRHKTAATEVVVRRPGRRSDGHPWHHMTPSVAAWRHPGVAPASFRAPKST